MSSVDYAAYAGYQSALAERNRHMAEMYAAGMNMREIAHEFMITQQTVNWVLQKLGIPSRSRHTSVRWAVPS